jgi:hypothetical protein
MAMVPWTGSSPPATLPSFSIDTHTYGVSQPAQPGPAHGGFPWWLLGFAVVPLLLFSALRRIRRRPGTSWARASV